MLRGGRSGSRRRRHGSSARRRLTLLYSGTFLLMGTILIVAIFLLASTSSTIDASSAVPGPGTPRRIVVQVHSGISAQHNADLRRLLVGSWVLLAVTAVISAVFGWFASGRVLRPLREMTDTARTISAGNLGERLALAGPDDEFKQLGDTLNELLARLEASFDAQRRFVANASHELRTPLTVERTLLQVALADPYASAASLRATCEELLASGREHEQLLEALLTLASSERGLEQREPIDLADFAGEILASPRPETDGGPLQLQSTLDPALTSGDATLVKRLIRNLFDNAIGYNLPGGSVEVRTGTDGDRAVLTVSNAGQLIAADELDRLFEPFRRLGGRRTAGEDGHHGLGLSIVRAIAVAHGATVVARPRPEGGLTVTVSFEASVRAYTASG